MNAESEDRNELLAILCHPAEGSFSHALADVVHGEAQRAGIRFRLIDLYASQFSPVLTREELRRRFSFDDMVLEHQRLLPSTRRLVIIHPDWWGGPPALLKGWVDRVFRPEVAYRFTGREFTPKQKQGLLGHLEVLVAYTSDAKADQTEASIERFWGQSVFGFCGTHEIQFAGFHEMHASGPGERTRRLRQFRVQISEWLSRAPAERVAGKSESGRTVDTREEGE